MGLRHCDRFRLVVMVLSRQGFDLELGGYAG